VTETPSTAPPSNKRERTLVFTGHAVVNGTCALAVAAMHIWGTLDANVAAGIIGAIAGLWGLNTRKGPPAAMAGISGLAASAVQGVRNWMSRGVA